MKNKKIKKSIIKYIIMWVCNLLYSIVYNLYLSYFQCNLIFTKFTNSAYFVNITLVLYLVLPYN